MLLKKFLARNVMKTASRPLYWSLNRCKSDISPNRLQKGNRTQSEDELDVPIKYMSSPASKWKAAQSRGDRKVERLWYEPHVIVISVSVFMIYFCMLREENQLDKELGKSLYETISGLEEQQLEQSLIFNKSRGLDTTQIEQRLKELRES